MSGKIFIIDDDKSIRRSLSLFLIAHDFQVEAYCSAEDFLEREAWCGTGCIILDVNLEGKSGLALQAELSARDSILPIIFITGRGNIHMSVQTLKMGALNYLEKPFQNEELLQSISEALELSQKLKEKKEVITKAQNLTDTLTPREFEILKYLLSGILNKQIAYELDIAEHTVKLHRHHICEKLGVKSIPELIRIADMAGIVPFEKKY